MKHLFADITMVALVVFAGWTQATPGGPGTTEGTANTPIVGEAKDMFNLNVPTTSTKLTQGGTKELAISVARGKNFDEDVTLTFGGLPKGVTVEPVSPDIRHRATETKIVLAATDNASPGDFTVKLTGHPTKGADATNEFDITVEKK
jgi:hypothetical protein